MNRDTLRVVLRRGRSKAVRRRHPWVFSGSVDRVEGTPGMGDLVAVVSDRGEFLAWGHYSPHSQIRVRLVSWHEDVVPEGADFWRQRLAGAIDLRQELMARSSTTAYRLVYAESDGVPGLIADLYGSTLVVQCLTAGVAARRDLYVELLWELVGARTELTSLYERSDVDVRQREGLAETSGLLKGDEPPSHIIVREHGLSFHVDVRHGHKTGFYLDQRDNRERFRDLIARRAELVAPPDFLNVFAYTGGFAVYGLAAGAASVTNVDTSDEALAVGHENLRLNNLPPAISEDINGDAFQVLRNLRQAGRRFDVIVLDPPKFAFTSRDVRQASRGYKDINMQAMHLLKPGGLLFTYSCSGATSEDLFQKIIFGAALDTGRDVQMIGRMMQATDHPVALTFPEGAYLKGLICRVSL